MRPRVRISNLRGPSRGQALPGEPVWPRVQEAGGKGAGWSTEAWCCHFCPRLTQADSALRLGLGGGLPKPQWHSSVDPWASMVPEVGVCAST